MQPAIDKPSGTTIGQRMFVLVLTVFILIVALLLSMNHVRESRHKAELINLRLQDYNDRMYEVLELTGKNNETAIAKYVSTHRVDSMRVTLIRPSGRVVFDNEVKDYTHIPNHKNRKEVATALQQGSGFDISRNSQTLGHKYFYSATYYPADSLVIRSALPYDSNMLDGLDGNMFYLWMSVCALIVITLVLYRFINRLSRNVTKLRLFASRADRNESLDSEDLVQFSNDELGEISEYIIKLYKRLQRSKEEQAIMRKQLTQNIAHELKTPAATMQGYLETIIGNPDMDAETKQRFIERCYAQSQRLGSLLVDISTLNKMDDVNNRLQQAVDFDIAAIVRNIVDETTLERQEKNMEFHNLLPQQLPFRGDQSLVYSIFRNLTDNAIAYAGEGKSITLEVEEAPGEYLFTFRDNGVGIPPQHLSRIFERFYRVDKGRSRKLGGTGLGLAIVKNAVMIHGGTITVENLEEGGLAFRFSLARD
uniref:histidine kinase n=1 Tax=Prevotella sp. GTC17259 TaxID=3236795 RepID=A0AB33J4M4_9BACT